MKYKWYEAIAVIIGMVVLLGLLVTVIAVPTGFVGMKMWNWFIPLTFHNAPTLSIGRAIGLGAVVSAFRGAPKTENKKNKEAVTAIGAQSLNVFLWLGMLLFFGWVVHAIIT